MMLPQTPEFLSYIEAVKNDAPNKEELAVAWRKTIEPFLNDAAGHVALSTARINAAIPWGRGEKQRLYKELQNDYRLAFQIASEASRIKKTLREMKP